MREETREARRKQKTRAIPGKMWKIREKRRETLNLSNSETARQRKDVKARNISGPFLL
jgi:hypothetical protein